MKKILILFFCIFPATIFAKGSFDDSELLDNINNPDSHFYYHKLAKRYLEGDTSLDLDDYYHLYYGFAYNEKYEPYKTLADNAIVSRILAIPEPTDSDIQLAINALEASLLIEPFNLSNINLLAYFYYEINDNKNSVINSKRLEMIVKTIISSGTGKKEKSPFQVIYTSHADEIMTILGIPYKNKMIVSIYCEYYSFYRKTNGSKGYYFDFRRIYLKERKYIPRNKENKGFEINGIRIK